MLGGKLTNGKLRSLGHGDTCFERIVGVVPQRILEPALCHTFPEPRPTKSVWKLGPLREVLLVLVTFCILSLSQGVRVSPSPTGHPEHQREEMLKLHTPLLLCGETCALARKGAPAADISREGRAGQGCSPREVSHRY